jgi:pimeloyl-ACP methyl ester carboxylesterase
MNLLTIVGKIVAQDLPIPHVTTGMAFFPSTEFVIIPGAGHEMFEENPQASIAAVREYLGSPAR